jgi:2-phosphosulfolactate phosphatase
MVGMVHYIKYRLKIFIECRAGQKAPFVDLSIRQFHTLNDHLILNSLFSMKREISIESFSQGARNSSGVTVVIDVFRAFTVAAIALQNGAKSIIMVNDLDTALDLRSKNIGEYCIGERGGVKPLGFDYGNSPSELMNVRFNGETLIQTTSNGTRGILAAKDSIDIYAGSFVTAQATVAVIEKNPNLPVRIVPMGEKDMVRTDEDEICALYLRSQLQGRNPDKSSVQELIKTMSPRLDSKTLSMEDVECCISVSTIPFAVRVRVSEGFFVATAEQP